jgi:hypothetical protein
VLFAEVAAGRLLASLGVACQVVAPSLIPEIGTGLHVKADRG